MSTEMENAVAHPPLDDEFPSLEAPGVRRRLFTILAWAGGGFAAIAALSLVLASVFEQILGDIGIFAATLCVGAGLAGFVAVVRAAQQLDQRHVGEAKTLFWITVVACAVLINVFSTAFNIGGDSQLGLALVVWVALAVVATGAAVLAVLAIAIAIGFEDPLMLFVRSGVFVAAVFIPVCVIDSELWWVGLIGGFLLAGAVETTMNEALRRWYVPEEERRRQRVQQRNRHPGGKPRRVCNPARGRRRKASGRTAQRPARRRTHRGVTASLALAARNATTASAGGVLSRSDARRFRTMNGPPPRHPSASHNRCGPKRLEKRSTRSGRSFEAL